MNLVNGVIIVVGVGLAVVGVVYGIDYISLDGWSGPVVVLLVALGGRAGKAFNFLGGGGGDAPLLVGVGDVGVVGVELPGVELVSSPTRGLLPTVRGDATGAGAEVRGVFTGTCIVSGVAGTEADRVGDGGVLGRFGIVGNVVVVVVGVDGPPVFNLFLLRVTKYAGMT